VAVHFVHIGKTGGTAIKHVLRPVFRAETETALGKVILHKGHTFKLADVPRGDKAIFCVRDPLSLFVSAFHSRLRKGQPKFYFEWSPAEAAAFERFPTPQALAEGLGSPERETRKAAQDAMKAIQHIRGIRRFLGSPKQVMAHRRQIVYIGRQETLDDDWRRIRALLELPADLELPSDPKKAHRRQASAEPALDARAEEILRDYYAQDYEIIRACDRLRAAHGWNGEPPRRRLALKLALGG
jgi:hypothetical protein